MQWILFKLSYNAVRTFLLMYFMRSRLHFKNFSRKIDYAFALLHFVIMSLDSFLPFHMPIEVNFLLFIPYALFTVKDKWYIGGFWITIYAILYFTALDMSYFILLSIPSFTQAEILMVNSASKMLFLSLFLVLHFLLLFIVSKFKKEYSRLSWSNLFLFLATLVVIFGVEKIVYHIQSLHQTHMDGSGSQWFLLVYIGMSICLFITVILFQRMSSIFEMEMSHQAELDAIDLKNQHQEELERLYDQLTIRQHDFKQHMQTLVEMVKNGGNDGAEAYLKTYQEEITQDVLFTTGSPAVDALLTAKYLTMKKAGIEFRYSLYPFDKLPISTTQFCTLLGNLLDNAIEGIHRLPNPEGQTIQLRLLRLGDMLCLLCNNPCDPSTLQKTPQGWLSSKKQRSDGSPHSIGTRTIQRIVETAEGRCDFSVEKENFIVKVLLPFQEENTAG